MSCAEGSSAGLVRACALVALLLAPAAAAQTEIRKAVPPAAAAATGEVVAPTKRAKPSTPVTEEGSVVATAAEVTADGRATRLLMTFSNSVRYQIFTLADPYRVIIDIPNVDFHLAKDAGQHGRGVIQA